MLKFIKHHMDTISGVGVYPAISFVLFFGFFIGVLFWMRTLRRSETDHMASLPLNEGPTTTEPGTHVH